MGYMLWAVGGAAILGVGMFILIVVSRLYRKVEQGAALIRNGWGGAKVSFQGLVVWPLINIVEYMDISAKRIEIHRMGENGLICKDNMRADVQVAFFVRVNPIEEAVLEVAQNLGCKRASDTKALVEFFDAKFSEALKTVGKQFDYESLYTNREELKKALMVSIGKDLNGYILDDAAIDYLEQTPLDKLDPKNILDAEGIKKITDRAASQNILANDIRREEQKVIKKQDVEAREAILELERQLAEAEEKQKREIAEVTARERASAEKVEKEQELISEQARIRTEEELGIQEENKQRAIIVAAKNKERTDKVETERVEKDRALEQTDRERVVTLAQIEKDKAVEVEKKNIQEVIRERVMVERDVVLEEENIADTRAFKGADRQKQVAITAAQESAEQEKVKQVTAALAAKEAAKELAEKVVIEAEAQKAASEKEAAARKTIADALAQEEAVGGLSEVRVIEAKADANEKYGQSEATVIQAKATAEAKGVEAMAEAKEKDGIAEAVVMHKKFTAEADGIQEKAEAMKLFDGVGREHEEYKIQINKDLEVELAAINIQKDIAQEQAEVLGQALKSARIDIVGGDQIFFDRIVNAVTGGKSVDRYIDNSNALTTVKDTFFSGDADYFKSQLKKFVGQFGMSSDDLKNLTLSAALTKLISAADDAGVKSTLGGMLDAAKQAGLDNTLVKKLGL